MKKDKLTVGIWEQLKGSYKHTYAIGVDPVYMEYEPSTPLDTTCDINVAMLSYLVLKGSYTTFDDEIENLISIFKVDKIKATHVVAFAANSNKITLSSHYSAAILTGVMQSLFVKEPTKVLTIRTGREGMDMISDMMQKKLLTNS